MKRLTELLSRKKASVLDKWIDQIVNTYPKETAQFLRSKKDRFANPVGYALETETENLFDQLVAGLDPEAVNGFLDNIIRIRAIQDFTPSEALAFVFGLKDIVREVTAGEAAFPEYYPELRDLENSIDRMALIAFEVYAGCREDLYKARVKELHNNTYMALRRAGMLTERKKRGPEPPENEDQPK